MTKEEYKAITKFNGKIYSNNTCYFDGEKIIVSNEDIVDMFKYAIEDDKSYENNRNEEEITGIKNIIDKIIDSINYEMIINNSTDGIFDFAHTIIRQCVRKYYD